MHQTESEFLYHSSCDSCGSSDANSIYDDGHSFCFSCNTNKRGVETLTPPTQTEKVTNFITGEISPLPKRKIDLATTQKFNYQVGSWFGRPCQIANYYDNEKNLVAQKLRYANKEFQWLGDAKQSGLFGQHLWSGKGKLIVITEGEIDALTMSMLNQNRFPVVSIKSGAAGAKKDIQKSLEFLEGYESCVFMFDQDEHGKKSAIECAKLLSPNKAKIATLPLKDPNEMYIAGRSAELTRAMWDAKPYRPEGIILGTDIWEELIKEEKHVTAQYPFECLNTKTHGLRKGELVTITAGSGVGKSSFCRHIALNLLKQDFAVGYVGLEETHIQSALGIMGVQLKKPLHLTREGISEEDFRNTYNSTVGNSKFFMYHNIGYSVADDLLSKIRYFAKSCDVDFVILDHLHMALSSLGDGSNNERQLIDYFVSKLRALVEETGIGLILVSHLSRAKDGNKGYEDGLPVTMNSLRGSASIAQLSNMVISLSRDLQSDTSLAQVNILKNRFSGETGKACTLQYNLDTGCLTEVKAEVLDDF
jgi:twinkle protein